jgi:hypothetical protein
MTETGLEGQGKEYSRWERVEGSWQEGHQKRRRRRWLPPPLDSGAFGIL